MATIDERPFCLDCDGYISGGIAAYEPVCCCDSDDESDDEPTPTEMTYKEWDAHTTEQQNRYGYKGVAPSAGALAKVSIYEFVNDWVRPEISWKILSYVAECPHKEGVIKALTHRRRLITGRPTQVYRRGEWRDEKWWGYGDALTTPYTEMPLYKNIDAPYDPVVDEPQRHIRRHAYLYDRSDLGGRGHGWAGVQSVSHLKYVNQLVNELKNYNVRPNEAFTAGNPCRYNITNKQLADALKVNKVKGHSKLCKGDSKVVHNTRRPAITALIKA